MRRLPFRTAGQGKGAGFFRLSAKHADGIRGGGQFGVPIRAFQRQKPAARLDKGQAVFA